MVANLTEKLLCIIADNIPNKSIRFSDMMIILAAPEETNYQMQKKIGIRNVKGIQCKDMDKA